MSEYKDGDELLDEYARRQMDGFVPQDSQESWRRFEQRMRPPRRLSGRRVAVAMVVLLFVSLGAAVAFPYELTAIGERIKHIRIYFEGTDGTIRSQQSHTPGDPGEGNLDPSLISTADLAKEALFPVLQPTWLPDGFMFRGHSLTDLGRHAKRVSSHYESEGRILTITQVYAMDSTSTEWFDTDDTTRMEAVVRGVPATILYRQKDSWSSLSWNEADITYKITGSVPPDTMIRIADSMQAL